MQDTNSSVITETNKEVDTKPKTAMEMFRKLKSKDNKAGIDINKTSSKTEVKTNDKTNTGIVNDVNTKVESKVEAINKVEDSTKVDTNDKTSTGIVNDVNTKVEVNKEVNIKSDTSNKIESKTEEIVFDKFWAADSLNGSDNIVNTDSDLKKEESKVVTNKDEYEQFKEDSFLLSIIEARKSGKTPNDILKDLSGINVDELSHEQLYESMLRRTLRLTQSEKREGKTLDDIIKDGMSSFSELSRVDKDIKTQGERDRLDKENNERFNKYLSNNKTNNKVQEEWNAKTKESIDTFFVNIKDKKYFGLTMTDTVLEKVKNTLVNDFNKMFLKEDGGYNVKFAFEQSMYAVPELRKLMWETAERNIRADERAAILKEFNRTDSNSKQTFSLPPKNDNQPKTAYEAYKRLKAQAS